VDNARTRVLIGLVAALAALRLLVVPWANAQGEARERLQVLTQRLDRSQGVVQARADITAAEAQLKAGLAGLDQRFPEAADAQAFKLQAQRELERRARESGMDIKVFEVIAEGELPRAGLRYARVRLGVRGALTDAARLHAAIEGELAYAAIREWQATVSTTPATNGESVADLVLVADLYYRGART
jgi:hypothetical protein